MGDINPNSFIKPTVVVDTAIGVLLRQIVLPSLVWRMDASEFQYAFDDTVTIRVDGVAIARDRQLRDYNTPLELDTIAQTSVAVQLTTDISSAVPLPDEQLLLDIQNFGREILVPQVKSVALRTESHLAQLIETAPYQNTVTISDDNIYQAFVVAQTYLNKNNVPQEDRTLVVGPNVYAALVSNEQFTNAAMAGDSMALRNGNIGLLGGMPVHLSNVIDANSAYLFHQTAFVTANIAPLVPAGVPFGASQNGEGVALRWMRDYSSTYRKDRSILNTYWGGAYVPDNVILVDDYGNPILDSNGDLQTTSQFIRAVQLTYTGSLSGLDGS
ncbi:P22 phage major capsid protein family protein [Tsukamurella soli]|uniref:P22 coat protein-gene protein 5 n=1 Tax=Tsukamurella soli TaxID=644556 RepID=A0ABP8JJJ2_9ACTN